MRARAAFVLVFLAFCSNVGTNYSFPVDSQLNLRSHLEPFQDCDVNIVQVILMDEPTYGNDLAPLHLPLIHTPLYYIPRKSWGQFHCDNRYFDILQQQLSGNMMVKQNARFNCKALLYITPKQCKTWNGGYDYAAVLTDANYFPIPWKLRNWLYPNIKSSISIVYGIQSSSFIVVMGNKGTLTTHYIRNIYTLPDYSWVIPTTFHMKLFLEQNPIRGNEISVIYLLLSPDWGNLGEKCQAYLFEKTLGNWKTKSRLDMIQHV